ncbi:MAG: peroxiredoxin family protein [Chloroflexaceae bacterium]
MLLTVLLIALGFSVYALGRRRHLRRASRQTGLIRFGRPAVLYFHSDHCAPCATQWRFLEQVQAQFGDGLAIEKIDADLESEKTERFGVFTLPTTLLMDAQGVVRHVNYGLADARKLGAQVQGLLLG